VRCDRGLDEEPGEAVKAATLLALTPLALLAQAGTGALAGTVRDTLGHPVRMVAVMVDSSNVTAITDDSGRFHLKGIRSGKNGFSMRKVGFSPVEFETTVETGKTLVLDIRMKPLQNLNPVNIMTTGSVRLHRLGFFERKDQGIGRFISPERIDSISHIPSVSMMVMQSNPPPTLERKCGMSAYRCDVSFRGVACTWLFVDGHQVDDMRFDDAVAPIEVYAIEMYPRPILVPAAFQGRLKAKAGRGFTTGSAGCAAIAVWTRNKAAP
jgi:hypothetical protein